MIFGTADDGLVPIQSSPLVDSGDDTASIGASDLGGVNRVFQGAVDMGAYEYFVEDVFSDGFENP